MNELQIIVSQLRAERQRVAAIAAACARVLDGTDRAVTPDGTASPTERFRQACVEYLGWVLARFGERDRRLAEPVCPARSGGAPAPALDAALARRGTSHEALGRLAAAGTDWRDFARFFQHEWLARREAIEAELTAYTQTAARRQLVLWRAIAAIDADSILEERSRYARVRVALPPGVSLPF